MVAYGNQQYHKNPLYLGHTLMCKTEVIFKAQISKRKPREEWIQVENTHEPLVSQEDFDTANAKILSRKRQQKAVRYLFFRAY